MDAGTGNGNIRRCPQKQKAAVQRSSASVCQVRLLWELGPASLIGDNLGQEAADQLNGE